MKVTTFLVLLLSACAFLGGGNAQLWKYSQQLFNPFSWLRQPKTATTNNAESSSLVGQPSTQQKQQPPPIPLNFPQVNSSPVQPSPIPLEKNIKISRNSTLKPKEENTSSPSTTARKFQETTLTTNAKALRTTRIKVTPSPQTTHFVKSSSYSGTSGTKYSSLHHTNSNPHHWTTVPITTLSGTRHPTTIHNKNTNEPKIKNNSGATDKKSEKKNEKRKIPNVANSASTPAMIMDKLNLDRTGTTLANLANYAYGNKLSTLWKKNPISSSSSIANSETVSTLSMTEPATVTFETTPSSSSSSAIDSTTSSTTTSSTTTTTSARTTTMQHLSTATQESSTGTTEEEPRDNHRQHDFYLSKREKPQVKIATNISQNLLPLPAGASAALVKPTKYHYYPHNQHIYLLPECAIQQVCNAVYVRLNWTQPLCACPSRYRDPCSASLNSDDLHTTELQVDRNSKRALTLVKTCEPTSDMRICRSPRDWSLLALQNIRTGKSHYLVICRCPDSSILEGPMSHDQPTYASVPGIRVYGMMCVAQAPNLQQINTIASNKRRGRPLRLQRRSLSDNDSAENPPFPWDKAIELAHNANWDDELQAQDGTQDE